jgi:hypothetical protein
MPRAAWIVIVGASLLNQLAAAQGPLSWIRVAADQQGFVLGEANEPFVPWGFNYDHDESGRLIEDYWIGEWKKVEQDFAEMKELGANVVRVHLQYGKFMETADRPNAAALQKLADLVKLAERTGLYLDLTGLGCYHKADVPTWYDALDESGRWNAQAAFSEAVAKTCHESPAVFCYDLMNEPVVPGGKRKERDWLGPPFGDKHFVQFITLDQAGRRRPEIAKAWIDRLVKAIRKHDQRHMVTVGLVDWSLERPGLTSGFVPSQVAGPLDFLCIHLYPATGKLDEQLKTLSEFAAVGKPVVIEETFILKCSLEDFNKFLDGSKKDADGWIGFYWGKTSEELRQSKAIVDAIVLAWLENFHKRTGEFRLPK